jgi:hypothetical protein
MLRRVDLVRIDVSEELIASIIRVPDYVGGTFLRNVRSYKSHTAVTSQKYGMLHSHSRENLKSYIALTDWTL